MNHRPGFSGGLACVFTGVRMTTCRPIHACKEHNNTGNAILGNVVLLRRVRQACKRHPLLAKKAQECACTAALSAALKSLMVESEADQGMLRMEAIPQHLMGKGPALS